MSVKEVQEERKAQREFEREQRMLQQAFNQQGELSRGWMKEILDVEELEDRLQPYTIKKIQAMVNKQWVVSNLTDAETHDRSYWLDVQRFKIIGPHPPEGSVITGATRAFLLDDDWEELKPLTALERNAVDQIITSLKNMVTRSRGGFERKQLNTKIARSENDSDSHSNDSGRLRGLFG